MANNYTQFSVQIGPLTAEQRQWFIEQCAAVEVPEPAELGGAEDMTTTLPQYLVGDPNVDLDAYGDVQFAYDFSGEGGEFSAFFYAEEQGNSWLLAVLLQKYLAKFHPDDCIGLGFACTCSKPRPDEFGGGAHFITADAIESWSSWDFVEDQNCRFKNAVLPARRLVQKAQALGIKEEQLDELVHEQQAGAAARIDNDGLESQLLYLVEQCGAEAVEQQLDELAAG